MNRFVLITVNHTSEELEAMVKAQSDAYIQILNELYHSFEWVEVDKKSHCISYSIVDDKVLEKLAKVYAHFEIGWQFEDLTKQVLRYDRDKLPDFEEKDKEIKELMYKFITFNTTIDTILEKISERGSSSLNKFESQMLKELYELDSM